MPLRDAVTEAKAARLVAMGGFTRTEALNALDIMGGDENQALMILMMNKAAADAAGGGASRGQ